MITKFLTIAAAIISTVPALAEEPYLGQACREYQADLLALKLELTVLNGRITDDERTLHSLNARLTRDFARMESIVREFGKYGRVAEDAKGELDRYLAQEVIEAAGSTAAEAIVLTFLTPGVPDEYAILARLLQRISDAKSLASNARVIQLSVELLSIRRGIIERVEQRERALRSIDMDSLYEFSRSHNLPKLRALLNLMHQELETLPDLQASVEQTLANMGGPFLRLSAMYERRVMLERELDRMREKFDSCRRTFNDEPIYPYSEPQVVISLPDGGEFVYPKYSPPPVPDFSALTMQQTADATKVYQELAAAYDAQFKASYEKVGKAHREALRKHAITCEEIKEAGNLSAERWCRRYEQYLNEWETWFSQLPLEQRRQLKGVRPMRPSGELESLRSRWKEGRSLIRFDGGRAPRGIEPNFRIFSDE